MVAAGAPWARRILFALAIFQILSTLLGFVTLVFFGDMYQEALANTPFAGSRKLRSSGWEATRMWAVS